MVSPVGLVVAGGSSKQSSTWKVGKKVGSGACASVHLLQLENGKSSSKSSSDCQWVVKIAPLPVKTTKKKNSLPERHANMIYKEQQLYCNTFTESQGDTLPRLPTSGMPSYGKVGGFTYYTMERMEAPLWDVVSALLLPQQKASSKGGDIDIGPIAKRLVSCVENVHTRNYLMVDVKPENFMLASQAGNQNGSSKTSKTATANKKRAAKSGNVAEDLATKVRMLDLGLAEPYRVHVGHRPDEGITEVVGTPLYASRFVHELHTPSRRDDIECVGFVVAEMIMRLVAESNGTAANYEPKTDNDMASYLPWSLGTSDSNIGEMKAKEVANLKSKFYQRMGDKETAKIMKEFFDCCKNMKYKETPDYVAISDLLSSLVVSVDATTSTTITKKKAAATSAATKNKTTAGRAAAAAASTATGRTTRSKRVYVTVPSDSESEEEISPQKQQKVAAKKDDDDSEFVDAAMEVDSDEETVFEDSSEYHVEEMDWEFSKENTAEKPKTRLGLTLMITGGPHTGERFELLKGVVNSVVIGKDPKSSKLNSLERIWELSDDTQVANSHVKLDLKATKQSSSIKITDLKMGTTVVNKTTLKKGKDMQAFIGGSFSIGDSTFTVKELSKVDLSNANPSTTTKKAAATKKKNPLSQFNRASTTRSDAAATKKAPPAKLGKVTSSKTGSVSVILEVVGGPHKGETFALVEDDLEIINLGSASSAAKKGEPVVLASDPGIEKRHTTFKLVVSRKLVKVAVKDLSESGTFVNGKQTAKGKEHMTFLNDLITIGDDTEIRVKLG